jgi:hypothetical protein
MQGDRGAAPNPPVQTSVLGAWEVQTDLAVTGLRTLAIPLGPASRRP